jgi:hypothetical protein
VTVSNYLKTAVGAQIVLFEAQAIFLNEICAPLHIGPNRVSRVPRIFRDNNTLPLIPLRGRPKRVPPEILDFIDARTLQSAHLSLANSVTRINRSTVMAIRANLGFHYQQGQHIQDLEFDSTSGGQ